MTITVLQTNRLLARCEAALAERFEVLHLPAPAERAAFFAANGPRIRAIAGHAADAALMDLMPNLEIIANFGVGYDGIDTQAARARNIRVTNTPDVLTDAVAELAVGMMIGLARQIPRADRYVRDGKWQAGSFPFASELNGKTVGIAGLGRIGKEIAARLTAMRMRVVYFGRREQSLEPYQFFPDLIEMTRAVDWLVAVMPGGAETAGLIGRDVLEALGPEGRLLNIGRGTAVDEPVLVEFLQSGRIAGAVLDVFADEPNVPAELLELDNVLLTPHIASATAQTRNQMADLLVANLDAHFAGDVLPSAVA